MSSSIASPEVLSSSSSSSTTTHWVHDVFLSFQGKDTRNNFTAYLYKALCEKEIKTYMDDGLQRGEEIFPTLVKAIEESRISIIIFSENYASSTWCLRELIKILECMEVKKQKVLPVFYNIKPSTIRHQKGSFKKALAKHKNKYKDGAEIQRWKKALNQVADISGFPLEINGKESELIEKIVQEVSKIVLNCIDLHVAEYPVGIKSHVKAINMLLRSDQLNDIRMIGIFGIGGIGKTTIAKELYNLTANQFEGRCFLANIRESSNKDQGGLKQLQEKILCEILRDSSLRVTNVYRGINLMREKLCRKKILLVLDDVDHLDQLEKLCGRCDWFGLGSRIIITTRDKGLLTKHDVELNYLVKEMDHDEALELFCRHAFKSEKPNYGFEELTEVALCYAGGLPLALKVVGSNLRGEDISYWKCQLEKYKRLLDKDIYEILKVSYDGLDDFVRNIFLDIACFFKGEKREYVNKILCSCDFFPDVGMKKLIDKSLITIDEYDRLVMHDLLQDMGKEIIRQESEEPGKRSRLYFIEDVREVLENNKGTKKVEGILINLPWGDHKMIRLGSEVFAKMEKLRIIICRSPDYYGGLCFCGGFDYLSNELRVLDWPKCPLEFLPTNFHGEKLIVLKIDGSMIREIGMRLLSKNLTSMDFRNCVYLTKISDLSSCSNLEKLILGGCESLVEVHNSVGCLDKLVELDFYGCSRLKKLPRSFKLRSLELLELTGCISLENFPEIECEMKHLKRVLIQSPLIQELPSSVAYLTGLEHLYLHRCESLVRLPLSIFQLQRLENVDVIDCPNFVSFDKVVPPITSSSLSTEDYFSSPSDPCPQSNSLFKSNKFSSNLSELDLSDSGIVSLPPCIEGLVGLRCLGLVECKQLEEIPQLPANIEEVNARGCVLLERFPHVSSEYSFGTPDLKRLKWIDLSECNKMHVNVGNHAPNPLLLQVRFQMKTSSSIIFPGSKIPEWFTYLKDQTAEHINYCEIEINDEPLRRHEIVAIVLCVVLGPLPVNFTVSSSNWLIGQNKWLFASRDQHRVWLQYIAANSIEIQPMHEEGSNPLFRFKHDLGKPSLRSVGVHLIYKNEDVMDPIQLSKRYGDFTCRITSPFGSDHPIELRRRVDLFRSIDSTFSTSEEAMARLNPFGF